MKVYRRVQRQALKRVDKIIVFTPKHYESSQQLHQLDVESKIVSIPIGIDFERLDINYSNSRLSSRIREFSMGRPTLLTVGRHVSYKGYEYLIAAYSKLRCDAVLVMVGSGILTEVLKKQAKNLKLEDRILFLGEVDDASLVSALHSCDIFCQPSVSPSEAFGISSAEAMACGKPTIVCELNNGVNYLNRDGETGLTVPPRNVDALAIAIEKLVTDEELRFRMGVAAKNWVRSEFSIAAMKRGVLELYGSLF
jgi:rhamnosyl/mannosyltransferase